MSPADPHLAFATTHGRYAVPADRVEQVVWLPVVSEAVAEDGARIGVAQLQDDEVPVADLDLAFGDRPEPYTLDHRLVELSTDEGSLGVVATEVDDVVTFDDEAVQVVEERGPVAARARRTREVTEILDVDELKAFVDEAETGEVQAHELFSSFDDAELEELARRQRTLVSPRREAKAPEGRRAVVVRVGSSPIVVALDDIREFVRVGRVTPLPTAADHVLGLANHRGEIVSLVDVGPALGLEGSIGDAPELAALVDLPEGPAGIAVDRVGETIELDEDALGEGAEREGVRGSVRREGGPAPVLDPVALLRSSEIVVDQGA